MDSTRPEVLEAFASVGTEIIKDGDQYATDFIKSLRVVNDQVKVNPLRSRYSSGHKQPECNGNQRQKVASGQETLDVIVLGGLGGRADQAFSQLHYLYAASADKTLDRIGHIYLVTQESIIMPLEKGFNRIKTPVEEGHIGENVGIIPLGTPSTITTKGLEWDVTDWNTSFGTQLSTSNHIRASYVEVMTSERVLFTVEIAGDGG